MYGVVHVGKHGTAMHLVVPRDLRLETCSAKHAAQHIQRDCRMKQLWCDMTASAASAVYLLKGQGSEREMRGSCHERAQVREGKANMVPIVG